MCPIAIRYADNIILFQFMQNINCLCRHTLHLHVTKSEKTDHVLHSTKNEDNMINDSCCIFHSYK